MAARRACDPEQRRCVPPPGREQLPFRPWHVLDSASAMHSEFVINPVGLLTGSPLWMPRLISCPNWALIASYPLHTLAFQELVNLGAGP